MRDTAPLPQALVGEAVLRQTPVARLEATLALSETMRDIALAGLRARHPGHSTIELVEVLTGERLVAGMRCGPLPPR